MSEKKLKGLFGGGEATETPTAPGAAKPPRAAREGGGRRGGGGRRRRRFDPADDPQAHDFINRYMTGHPSEGFSSDEAINYLQQMRGQVPPEVMQRAAVQTVQNLPEEQRKAFGEMLQRRRAGTGMVTIERTGQAHEAQGRGGESDDPLGGLFGELFGGGAPQPMPQPRPGGGSGMDDMLGGLLGTLLGGGMTQPQPSGRGKAASDPFGDILGGLLGSGGGGMAMPAPELEPRARQQPQEQGGGIGDILSSPLGKAVLGGIAAYAMKEMMDQSRKR